MAVTLPLPNPSIGKCPSGPRRCPVSAVRAVLRCPGCSSPPVLVLLPWHGSLAGQLSEGLFQDGHLVTVTVVATVAVVAMVILVT